MRRGSGAPASPTLHGGHGEGQPPPPPLPQAGEACPAPPVTDVSQAAPGGGEGVPAPERQQGAGSGFILPEQLYPGGLGKGGKTVSETYFWS